MILYEGYYFRNKEVFKTWKEAVDFAYNEMNYILNHEEIFPKKVVKKALEEFEDLVICRRMSTEEELHEDFRDGGIGCTGLYEITYIKENYDETKREVGFYIPLHTEKRNLGLPPVIDK